MPGVANGTKPNQKSIELSRTKSMGLLFDWFGNRTNQTLASLNFSVDSINRTREFDYRTQSNLIEAICSILLGRNTKRFKNQ